MVSLTSTLPLVPVLMLAGRQSQKVLAVAQPQR
jgi:hypothetical protein